MTLTDHAGWRAHLPAAEVAFSTKPAALARADLIALCVKSGDTHAAARQIAAHAKRKPVVISFQNGVSNAKRLRAALPGHAIVQAVVPFNVAHVGSGRWHKGTSGELVAGEHEAARALAAQIGSGPAQLRIAPDIESVAWGKLLINLNNAVNALSGETLLEQLAKRDYRRVLARRSWKRWSFSRRRGSSPHRSARCRPNCSRTQLPPQTSCSETSSCAFRRSIHTPAHPWPTTWRRAATRKSII
jgi:2-dehydropantoate 2-reductase